MSVMKPKGGNSMQVTDSQLIDSLNSTKAYMLRCHSFGAAYAIDEIIKRYEEAKRDLSSLKVPASMKPALWTDPDMLHR